MRSKYWNVECHRGVGRWTEPTDSVSWPKQSTILRILRVTGHNSHQFHSTRAVKVMKDSPLWLQIWLQDIIRKWGKIRDLDFLRDGRNSNNSCPQDIGCSLNILHPCLAGTFCSHRNQTCESASSPTLTRARCWVKPKSKFLNNASASSTTFVANSQFCLRFLKTLHSPKFVRNPKSSYLEDICYSFLADFLSDGRIWAGQENDGKRY